jgi:hypothetical protein
MPERLSPILQQAYEATRDRALKGAASVAQDVRRPGRSLTARESPAIIAEIRHAERLALRDWAERCGFLVDDAAFTAKWESQGRMSGQENDVFLDAGRVRKGNNLTFHLSYISFRRFSPQPVKQARHSPWVAQDERFGSTDSLNRRLPATGDLCILT